MVYTVFFFFRFRFVSFCFLCFFPEELRRLQSYTVEAFVTPVLSDLVGRRSKQTLQYKAVPRQDVK